MKFEGLPEITSSISKWLKHSKKSLKGDAHDKVGLTVHEDTLHGVQEIREQKDIDLVTEVKGGDAECYC